MGECIQDIHKFCSIQGTRVSAMGFTTVAQQEESPEVGMWGQGYSLRVGTGKCPLPNKATEWCPTVVTGVPIRIL